MENCVLINSYTNTEYKLGLLRENIKNLKTLDLKIILCSGCDVPDDVLNQIDYFILNKEKLIKPALFYKEKFNENKSMICAHYAYNERKVFFHDNIDLTVSKNIKLLFTLAKFLGYKNAVYLDYDTIFLDTESYINKHLEILEKTQSKMCVIETDVYLTNNYSTSTLTTIPCFYLTHFFSNVDFLLENFKLPCSEAELKDDYIIDNISPWSMPEISFYKSFKSNIDQIYKIDFNFYNDVINCERSHVRDDDINYLIKQRVCFVKKLSDNKVFGMIINTSTKKCLKLIVKTKFGTYIDEFFNPNCWYMTPELSLGDFLETTLIENDNKVTVNLIYNSEDKILAYEY